ncbi:hypothetical protein AVEN_210738-1 [Araneus ventricosus]|uniref:Uncharacterized protein n=1 Tax=Araneus ventricosus TaxID=182803 RepID=A0A4Y2UJX9_ARAVE|nr:hypothetical protein AVEN_210738-1 [Araneus ventricosus]
MGHFMNLLRNQLIPALQQRGCVNSTIFMKDGAPPHIVVLVKQLLNLHFGNDNCQSPFPNSLSAPITLTRTLATFGCGGYLNDIVCGSFTGVHLAELKNRISQHIYNMTTETLRSVVEHCCFAFSAHRRKWWTAY